MRKIAVTGGSGTLGSRVLKDLQEHGYETVNLDNRQPAEPSCRTIRLDLGSLGEVYGALRGVDAVVHMAAIPSPGGQPNEVVFTNNVVSTFNILEAAAGLEISRVVLASSESAYGFCYAEHPFGPFSVPVNEDHPLAVQDCYGLSKAVGEANADMFRRRTNGQAVSLRFACVLKPDSYFGFIRHMHASPANGKRILWNYIDVRDAAAACRLSLEKDGLGSEAFNICADETFMEVPTRVLLDEYYPGTYFEGEPPEGNAAIVSNEKAKRLLGWKPEQAWRNFVSI